MTEEAPKPVIAQLGSARRDGGLRYYFRCPACDAHHVFSAGGPKCWQFNGDMVKPTVSPSLLVTKPGNPAYRCHSFIKDGRIEFCGDCSHKHKGKTMELPPWENS